MTSQLQEEIQRRRTFAIISHPDAGKTTLTEKLLLYGGAIQKAGMVTRKEGRNQTVSDFMDIEKTRGISISSSALQFEWDGHIYNLLDTPGHQDFSEDTYRTLMAVDSAVMLMDAAKGVEPQTIKLFKVCRERGIPIFTFINKMDRPSLSPFELLDEVEKVLGIVTVPITWPIGEPGAFRGVFNRLNKQVSLYERTAGGQWKAPVSSGGIEDPAIAELIGEKDLALLKEELEMVEGLLPTFDQELFEHQEISPVFFGCAVNNFGLEGFLEHFTKMAPQPAPLVTHDEPVPPESEDFTAFVYKVMANMNQAHRDRMAFIRIASGRFEKNMSAKHLRTGKKVKLSYPYRLFGGTREIIEEAWPGDIVGLVNPGTFKVGDVLTTGPNINVPQFPRFAPELFARIRLRDQSTAKSFRKGVSQLGEEGVVQVFYDPKTGGTEPVLAAVGQLQLEVFSERMKSEYRCEVVLNTLDYSASRWLVDPPENVELLGFTLMEDEEGRPVALFRNEWHLNQVTADNPKLKLLPHPPENTDQ